MNELRTDLVSLILSLAMKLSMVAVLLVFLLLIGFIFYNGLAYISWDLFAWEYNSENVSMMPAIINTLHMIVIALSISLPLGLFGAIFLSEYGNKRSKILAVVRIGSDALVGIPSIVYGLFGYLAFVIYFGFKTSIIAGALTLAIMILPLILRSSEEALRAIPMSFREASFALGAGKLRTIFAIVVPAAIPGILAGVILSIGRIVGESAALLYTSGSVAKVASAMDSGRTLSVHMYAISSEGLHVNEAYSTAMVLIIIVFFINLLSNFIAKKLTKA